MTLAMFGVQKYLSVVAGIVVIHVPVQAKQMLAYRMLTADASATGSRQAVTKQISEAESALQLWPSCQTAAGSGLQWSVIDIYLDSQLNHS